ncbi:hypothetical protein H7F51_14750 [Novosphingobium flavum]|uniref:Uncharacterized protein n=1 Tax=Novosphingobium flavum TaxID=1778672 RepID=A0A7X1KML8_9SPHN|nr:hypothetical protein [Novosphingobium flavum]MBC2666776.1 hypothetical protein [Novosphingobium flavum]
MSLRQTLSISAAFAAVLHIAGCDRRPPAPQPSAEAASGGSVAPAVAASDPPPRIAASEAPPVAAPARVPAQALPTRSTGVQAPEAVLKDWAAAIEAHDWHRVRALWGHRGADSGLSPEAFERRWSRLAQPRVVVGPGEQEGAAGSSFYTAPVRIEDGAKTIAGTVTLRRVNDVPGAAAEQLRWHFDTAVRAPWTDPR